MISISEFYKIQNFKHISKALPLSQKQGIRFLFGCETEMDLDMNIGISKYAMDAFDFIIAPTAHFNFSGLTIPEAYTYPKQKTDFWIKKLNALLDKELLFRKIGAAHLTSGLIDRDHNKFSEL